MAIAKKILIVDDNVDAADMTAYLLQAYGLEVLVAYGGLEGLSVARGEHPALIFLDIGMPFMDGCEVAKAIRADAKLNKVKLVALAAWSDDASRDRVQNAGFDLHLTKPADPKELVTIATKIFVFQKNDL